MAAKPGLTFTVHTSGLFFRNPVGQLHKNIYDVLEEAAQVGTDSARSQLQPGHGYLTGQLYDSIQPRFVKAGRTPRFRGRARVIAGARGFEMVRFYAGRIDRKYKFMASAAKSVQSWAQGGQIQGMLHKDLS